MPIDPSKIQWDDKPDISNIKWDTTEQTKQNTKTEYYVNQAKKGLVDLPTIIGLPADAATGVLNLAARGINELTGANIPYIEHPYYGTEYFRKLGEKALGVKNIEPVDETQAALGKAVRFGAGNIAPGAWLMSKAPTALQKGAVAITEVSSAFLGGVGAQTGGQVAAETFGEEARPAGELTGGLFGSIAPVAATSMGIDAANTIKSLSSKDFQERLGKNYAAQQLQNELKQYSDGVRNLNRSQTLSKNIPGFSPSLGRSTNATGIISLENRLAEESSHNLAQAQAADRASIAAINAKFKQDFPKADVNITNAPSALVRRVTSNINSKIAENNKKIDALSNAFVKKPIEEIGARLRELRDEQELLARANKNTKYLEVYAAANKSGFTENTREIYNTAKNIIGDNASTFQKQSSVFSEILSKYKTEGNAGIVGTEGNVISRDPYKDIPFEELHSLVRRTNQEYYSSIDPSVKLGLGKLKTYLSGKIDSYKSSEYGDMATKLKEADNYWLNEYQNVFKKGAGAKLSSFNKYGDITPDEKIVSNIFLGRVDGMDQFRKIYGDSAEATNLLYDGIIDNFARAAKGEGDQIINSTKAYNFFKRYDSKLNQVPELYAKLKDNVSAIDLIKNRNEILKGKIKALNRSRFSAITGLRDNAPLIKRAIEDKRAMGALVKSVPSDAVRQSVIADYIVSQRDPYQYLLENLKAIDMGFGGKANRKHLVDLKRIAEAMSIRERSSVPGRVSTSLATKDVVDRRIGTTVKSIFSQFRAAAQGRVSQEYVITDIGGKFLFKIRQERANKLLQEAFYDKELADHLAELTLDPVKIPKETISFFKTRIPITALTTYTHTQEIE